MSLLEQLIGTFAPHICVGCGSEDNKLLCKNCTLALPHTPSRCYRCRATTRDFATCQSCRTRTPLAAVYTCTPYTGHAKELLSRAKYERARAGLREIAQIIIDGNPNSVATDNIIIPVPTATSRARQRGYDQSTIIAKQLARAYRAPYAEALVRRNQAHQVGANRTARQAHMIDAFRIASAHKIHGRQVVLVDDVLTTGATLEAAARILKKAGATRVDAIVFAQPD